MILVFVSKARARQFFCSEITDHAIVTKLQAMWKRGTRQCSTRQLGETYLCWTLCSFEDEPFLSRKMRLICVSSNLEKSQNYYRNGKHPEVLTWAKFSNP